MNKLYSLSIFLCMIVALNAMPFDVLPDISECELCRRIVGAAERHFRNNVTTQEHLKRELDRECVFFSHTHNRNVSQQCIQFVNTNIKTIFTDISNGKHPEQVCVDIKVCTSPSNNKAQILPQHDPCRTCNFIIGRAEHHFRKNETSDQLKGHLDRECKALAHYQGQEAATKCQQIIDANIQKIYNDMEAGKRPHQVCIDIGECVDASYPPTGYTAISHPPAKHASFIDVLPPRPDACHTCEYLIGRAEHHIHRRNVTDEKRLLRELEHECIQLSHVEGDEAAIQCLDIVRKDIDVIFKDVQNHKNSRQICIDIGECTSPTGAIPMSTPSASKKRNAS